MSNIDTPNSTPTATAQTPQWQKFDHANPPEEGAYWVVVNYDEFDVDVDDQGRTVGRPTGEVLSHVALARFDGLTDMGPQFDAVDRYLFGDIPEDSWVSHFMQVAPPDMVAEDAQKPQTEAQEAVD